LLVATSDEPQGKELANGVMSSLSSARQSEVKAWEEEIVACEHTITLQQPQAHPIAAEGLAKCAKCDLQENLWLCLTCGNLGCGRAQFGGVDGHGHALLHYNEIGHGAAVKLGTITPEGKADVYCYSCDDSKLDLDLSRHLSTFGINVQTLEKTQKTMTELVSNSSHSVRKILNINSKLIKISTTSSVSRTKMANLLSRCLVLVSPA
jgi:ubiquitin carboxyl-terminal hydrolase 5/13